VLREKKDKRKGRIPLLADCGTAEENPAEFDLFQRRRDGELARRRCWDREELSSFLNEKAAGRRVC